MSLLESDAPIAQDDLPNQSIPHQDVTLTPVLVEAPIPQTPQQAAVQLLTEKYDWFEDEPPTQPSALEIVTEPIPQATPSLLQADASPLDDALARLDAGDAAAVGDLAVHAERLSFSKQKRSKIVTLIPHLKRIVATSPDSATVAAAAGALWNVTFEPLVQAEVAALPGVLVRCINVHANDANVLECATGVLTNIAVVASSRVEVLKAGALEVVLNAVQRHRSSTSLLSQACQLFCLLGAKPEGKQRLIELGVNNLATELGNHPSQDIQEWSRLLLAVLK